MSRLTFGRWVLAELSLDLLGRKRTEGLQPDDGRVPVSPKVCPLLAQGVVVLATAKDDPLDAAGQGTKSTNTN